MSLVPEKRKCSTCGKIYSWNPDIGKIYCPHCMTFPFKTKKEKDKEELDQKVINPKAKKY